jgi:N6-adenosine-specific RNA methylase IME4
VLDELIKEGKKFPVLYIDPPWQFTCYSDKGKAKAPDKHYSTMSLEDIKKLPVSSVLEDDAVCFLWVYNPMIPHAFEVLKAWGLEFKTLGFCWRKITKHGKDHFGLGYYTRQSVELCLISTKGKPGRPKAMNVRQIIHS